MYKLIIVDDEEIIRMGLAELIDWNSIGFELVGCFEDGKETIDFLKDNNVDVVLTDVKMAEVSGLDLAKYIYENLPLTKTVIISGFKEFEYAKKAVDYNVVHYLLKPTRYDEVVQVFSKIKERLDKESSDALRQQVYKDKYRELIPVIKEQFFVDILMGVLRTPQEIQKRVKLLELDVNPDSCKCISMDILGIEEYLLENHWIYGREQFKKVLTNFLEHKKEGIHYYPVFHILGGTKLIAYSDQYDELEKFQYVVKCHMDETVYSVNKILNIKLHIQMACAYQSLCEFAVKSNLIFSGNAREFVDLTGEYRILMSNINDNNYDGVCNIIDNFFDHMRKIPLRELQGSVIQLLAVMTTKLAELGLTSEEKNIGGLDYYYIYQVNDTAVLRNMVKQAFKSLMDELEDSRNKSAGMVIEKAKRYIDENYAKDISLDDVASQVFLNASYFSRLFKLQMGQNFIDYLTGVRMKKAIDLIKSNRYKIYEVSEMVGYKSSRYFSRVFKQYTGCTVKDYIRIARQGGE